MGDVDALTPTHLRRLLASLTVSQALVVDAIRGRSIRQADVADVRQAIIKVRRVLDALDDARPWEET